MGRRRNRRSLRLQSEVSKISRRVSSDDFQDISDSDRRASVSEWVLY